MATVISQTVRNRREFLEEWSRFKQEMLTYEGGDYFSIDIGGPITFMK